MWYKINNCSVGRSGNIWSRVLYSVISVQQLSLAIVMSSDLHDCDLYRDHRVENQLIYYRTNEENCNFNLTCLHSACSLLLCWPDFDKLWYTLPGIKLPIPAWTSVIEFETFFVTFKSWCLVSKIRTIHWMIELCPLSKIR